MTTDRDDDRDLARAFRAVKERYDGTHPDTDATLRQVLVATRKRERTRRITRWGVLPLAATLAASTAWAGATGRLSPAISTLVDTLHGERAQDGAPKASPTPGRTPRPTTAPAEEPATPSETREPAPPTAAPVNDPTPAIAAPSASASVARVSPPPSASPPPRPSAPSSADPNAALFAEAHHIHFGERDPARALDAWDRYLAAAPTGRFAPEARYNRALSLVRLGRHAEAKAALDAFASGAYGEYRRNEARALLDALARDE